jgi:hypothetical protein
MHIIEKSINKYIKICRFELKNCSNPYNKSYIKFGQQLLIPLDLRELIPKGQPR